MSAGTDPRVGTELLEYRLEELVGRGGMGVVYRAYDPRLKRDVALKLLAPEYAADERFRERFLTETERAASLEHPNVIPIHDAGEVDGQLYLVMRLADGGDLKTLLGQEKTLEPSRAVSICAQLADALDTAHGLGLVHRDVKPSNVLFDRRGHTYLADFGLSRRLADQAPGFDAGLSLGTPAYVAPEQIEGKAVDGQADQYSLACLLFECLGGRPPYPRGSEAATLFAHLEEPPPSLPGLENVLERGLAKDPAARYPSCTELVDAARVALGVAEPRRRRWVLVAAGLIALLLVAAAGLAGTLASRADPGAQALPGADHVVRIDPSSNEVVDRIPVGRKVTAVAVADDHVWVASFADGEIWRIDPHTKQELRVSTQGSPIDLVLSGSNAVAANGPQHTLAYVDDDTGVAGSVDELPGEGNGVIQVASGESGLWLDDPSLRVVRRDPRTGSRQTEIPSTAHDLGGSYRSFDDIAVGFGSVWLAGDTFERIIWRIDPTTGRVVTSIRLPFAPGSLGTGERGVWVTSLVGDSVARIDPTTNRVVATIPVAAGPVAIAAGEGSIWVASATGASITRIDPATNRVVATIPVDGSPVAIDVGPAGVWAATHERAPAVVAGGIRIGILTDCTGTWAFARDHTLAGAELPLLERGATRASGVLTDGVVGSSIGGHPIDLRFGCSDGTSVTTLTEARRLVEEEGSEIVIGPLTGDEGLALQDYARRHPAVAFVNGTSSSRQLSPAPNFFSFHTDGLQWMAGVGTYAYRDLGWRRAEIIAGDDSFSWAQVAGFTTEFCSLGGTTTRTWVPAGTDDYSGIIARLPRAAVDGFVVVSSARAVLALANGYPGLQGNLSHKVILGVGTIDELLEPLGPRASGVVVGNGVQFASHNAYTSRIESEFPHLPAFLIGSAFDLFYYGAMKATLAALDDVRGDVTDPHALLAALGRVQLDLPQGRTALDRQRRGIAPNYVLRLGHGKSVLPPSPFRTVPAVAWSFGGHFRSTDPPPSRTTPACKHGHPPPWATR